MATLHPKDWDDLQADLKKARVRDLIKFAFAMAAIMAVAMFAWDAGWVPRKTTWR